MANRFFINREGLNEVLQKPSAWVLIAVNLGLIVGVVAWDWRVFDIVFLYWVENLVIGVINVMKMIASAPAGNMPAGNVDSQIKTLPGRALKLFLVPFFIVHYGGFCFGHGVFIFAMFSDGSLISTASNAHVARQLLTGNMTIAISLLAGSHLFSFLHNYIGAGEYRRTNAAALMMRPYGRIVALHLTIIFGAFLTMVLGSPMGLLVILMVLKTAVDLAMHGSERKKLQGL